MNEFITEHEFAPLSDADEVSGERTFVNGFIRVVETHFEISSDMFFSDERAVVAGLIREELRKFDEVTLVGCDRIFAQTAFDGEMLKE